MPDETMRRLMDRGTRLLRHPRSHGLRAGREAVNWADLAVVEVHESRVLTTDGRIGTQYTVVVEEASPDAFGLCVRLAEALEKAVPEAGVVEVSTRW